MFSKKSCEFAGANFDHRIDHFQEAIKIFSMERTYLLQDAKVRMRVFRIRNLIL
jgi:hypothetical protein